MPYISITGLQLKARRYSLRFWWHAIASMAQARKSDGLISVDARKISGVHHTLSVWSNKAAMRRYLASGAHLNAMRAFSAIATGKTMGFESDRVPDWGEVHQLWRDKATAVGHQPGSSSSGGAAKQDV